MITKVQGIDVYRKTNLRPIFSDASDLDDLDSILINQDKAKHSLDLGLSIRKDGYNIYLSGESSSRRKLYLDYILKEHSKSFGAPNDYCYVNNFNKDNKYEPILLDFKAGYGFKFKSSIEEFAKNLKEDLKNYFSSDSYRSNLENLDKEYYNEFLSLMNEYTELAREKNFLLYSENGSVVAVMCDKHGRELSERKITKFALKYSEQYSLIMQEINSLLSDLTRRDSLILKNKDEKLLKLDKDIAKNIIDENYNYIREVLEETSLSNDCIDKLKKYFNGLEEYILDNLNLFKDIPQQLNNPEIVIDEDSLFEEYFKLVSVNLFVDNKELKNAPVIFSKDLKEEFDLFGGIMYEIDKKNYSTDTNFLNIVAGDLVKANGGYLVLDIKELLVNDLWEELKKCLVNKEVKLIGKASSTLVLRDNLKPEPIPIDVKVILVGSLDIYNILFEEDSDFRYLFDIHSKFEYCTDRTEENELLYARLLKKICDENNLNNLSYDAICRLIEYSSKLTGDKNKLILNYLNIYKVLIEADNLSKRYGRDTISVYDIDYVIEDKIDRVNFTKKYNKERIQNDEVILSVHDSKVGEINALTVVNYAEYSIGDVSKITANTYKTRKYSISSSDKEGLLTGRIHDKALHIVLGYLGETFGQNKEFPYSINITFEQLYGGVEGDSATLAKACAILSNLSNTPIKQKYGITGSMNQKGEAQMIGGVNEKIEGFYDLCKAKGLEDGGGVIIPRSNLNSLMLPKDIVRAIEDGDFTIYAIDNIKDAMEILTGDSFDNIISKIKSKY